MIGMRCTQKMNPERVIRAKARAQRKVLFRQGGYVRTVARRSVKLRADPGIKSPPGSPPFTHQEHTLRNAILFAVERVSAVVGGTRSRIGRIAHTHEFGGVEPATKTKPRRRYPPRPIMGPALIKSQPRLNEFWRNAIKA